MFDTVILSGNSPRQACYDEKLNVSEQTNAGHLAIPEKTFECRSVQAVFRV